MSFKFIAGNECLCGKKKKKVESLDQWFSTAGPHYFSAGPHYFSAGPQQFISILLFKEALRVQK